MKLRYQLWCYYETEDKWVMEGFFHTKGGARDYLKTLKDNVETPCMPTWEVVEVTVL
jgi:hypothetical protein